MPRGDSLSTRSLPLLHANKEKIATIEKINNVLVILVVISILLVIKLASCLTIYKGRHYRCCVLYHFVSISLYFVSLKLLISDMNYFLDDWPGWLIANNRCASRLATQTLESRMRSGSVKTQRFPYLQNLPLPLAKNHGSPMRSLLLIYIIWMCSSAGLAYAQPFYFNHYQVEHGLSNNAVLCSAQDAMGFMWFGTKDGLNRFDGYSFKVFHSDPDNPNGLGSNFVRALHVDGSGQVWVGTDQGI